MRAAVIGPIEYSDRSQKRYRTCRLIDRFMRLALFAAGPFMRKTKGGGE